MINLEIGKDFKEFLPDDKIKRYKITEAKISKLRKKLYVTVICMKCKEIFTIKLEYILFSRKNKTIYYFNKFHRLTISDVMLELTHECNSYIVKKDKKVFEYDNTHFRMDYGKDGYDVDEI